MQLAFSVVGLKNFSIEISLFEVTETTLIVSFKLKILIIHIYTCKKILIIHICTCICIQPVL